nr:MAG TPA_asm: hypothetical protein [Caudoviricetes sp.]
MNIRVYVFFKLNCIYVSIYVGRNGRKVGRKTKP